MDFKLKEVLWQFTLQCNKNCKYCGSKNVLNVQNQKSIDRIKIANQIVEASPEQITITGGQPSVLIEELQKCVSVLNDNNIDVKILTNGNLFVQDKFSLIKDKINLFGLSINEQADIEFVKSILGKIPTNKTTMVTNFGIHNIGLFDQLSKFSINFATWQVQLTIGNELQLDLQQIRQLKQKIQQFKGKRMVGVLEADNIVCGKCRAGICGCSICWNGDVIPCLSYRSWKNNLSVQGNVFDSSLKDIWKNQFQFYRNRQFVPCCKSISGIQLVKQTKNQNSNVPTFMYGINFSPKGDRTIDVYPQVTVYGVNINPLNSPMVYGVGLNDK